VLGAPDAAKFLGELRLVDLGILSPAETSLGDAPPLDATPVPARAVDAFVLRAVYHAIRERRALTALYLSMSRPKPVSRVVEPMRSHTTVPLARAGVRLRDPRVPGFRAREALEGKTRRGRGVRSAR